MQQEVSNGRQLTKKFFKYLVPSVSAMWFFSIYTMVDGIFVGKGIGSYALAAVNLSMPFVNTIFAVALLVAIGSSTLITFYFGKNEKGKSNEIFTLNVIILSALGIVTSVVALLFLDKIAIFLGATEETFVYVKDYLRIIIFFSTFFIVSYSLEVLVKADGFPIYSIVFVTLSALTNIVLDYILVIRFDYGIKGAAFATGFSQFISCVGFLIHFIFGKSNLKFVKPEFDFKLIKKLFVLGIPESLTELSAGFTTFIFNFVILHHIGPEGIAAFSVIMYLNNLVLMSMIAVNQGMEPLISFYNGREDQKSIKRLLDLALKTSLIFGLAFFVASQLFNEQLVSLFLKASNKEAFQISLKGLKIFSFGFLVCGINVVFSGYFTALKKTKKATIISSLRGYILVCIVLFILPNIFGDVGIWIAPLVYEGLTLSIALIIYGNSKVAVKEEEYSLNR